MEKFIETFNWVIANKAQIFAVLSSIIATASVISKITPTEVDNEILGKLLKLVDVLAVNNKPTTIKK